MSESEITREETGWNDSVVMICSKCGQEAERIRGELKTLCKQRMGSDVRVINTGCLDICPENKIAITIAGKNESETFRSYSVPVDVSAEDLFEELF